MKNENANDTLYEEYLEHEDEEILDITTYKKEKNSKKNKNCFNLTKAENFPSIFFIIMVFILSSMLFKYTPMIRSYASNKEIYQNKYDLEYFSASFKELNYFYKPLLIISLIFLFAIITDLTTLIKQRISVPELSNQKIKNYSILFFALISISSLIMIFLFNKTAIKFTKSFGLVDNIFNILFMLSTFIFCYLTFDILNKLSFVEKPADNNYIYHKKFILITMFAQKASYMINYCLINNYQPIINTEKILLSCLIIIMNINCILFFFLFTIFVFTMKYDIYYVNFQLELIPEMEFFTGDAELKCDMGKFVEI